MPRASCPGRGDVVVPAARPGQPAALLQRRPDLLALAGAAGRRQCAPPAGRGRMVPAAVPRRAVRPPEPGAERHRHSGAARFTNVAGAAGDADLQRRPHAGDQRDRRERPARSAAALRGRHRARARGRRERAGRAAATSGSARRRCRAPPLRPKPRWAARSRSTTAARSTCCRCSMRSARAWRCASAPTTANTQLLLDSVQLYKALGGGWQVFEPAAATAPPPAHATAQFLKPIDHTRNCLETVHPRHCSPCRSPRCCRVQLASRRRRSRCGRSHRRTPLRQDAAKRIATSAPCSRATRSTRRSASAARSSSARSTSARTCARATCIAVLDDTDYRLAVRGRATAAGGRATAQARQAESDRQRLQALKADGSVSASDDEQAQSSAQTTRATAEAEARKLDLARNRLEVHRAARVAASGVVTSVKFEVGQVVAEGQPVVSIANEGEPEIVVDVPEDQLAAFKTARYRATLRARPTQPFDVVLRELSPQAASQTRTYRARLKPATPRPLPLGATRHARGRPRRSATAPAAAIPAAAMTQNKGQPAVWVVRRAGTEPVGTVELIARRRCTATATTRCWSPVRRPATLVVTAGVQKMAPGLQRRAARRDASNARHRSRPPDEILQPHRMGARTTAPIVLFLIIVIAHRRRARLHQARPARGPELLRAVDDRDGHLAGRDRAADPGRGAQPHGEEVRAARPLREGRHVRAPGLRRHDDHA